MKNIFLRKVCAILLVITLVVGLTPVTVTAQSVIRDAKKSLPQVNLQNIDIAEGDTAEEPPTVLYELTEEREEKVKHFLMSNRTVQAVLYSEPVHYKEDGEWKDIDNSLTLEEAQNEADFTGYTNTQGDFSVKIAEETSGDSLVRLNKDDYELKFTLTKKQDEPKEETSKEVPENQITEEQPLKEQPSKEPLSEEILEEQITEEKLLEQQKSQENQSEEQTPEK